MIANKFWNSIILISCCLLTYSMKILPYKLSSDALIWKSQSIKIMIGPNTLSSCDQIPCCCNRFIKRLNPTHILHVITAAMCDQQNIHQLCKNLFQVDNEETTLVPDPSRVQPQNLITPQMIAKHVQLHPCHPDRTPWFMSVCDQRADCVCGMGSRKRTHVHSVTRC